MIPAIDPTYLTMLCDVIGGETLINEQELRAVLAASQIEDHYPGMSRRHRLYNAMLLRQQKDGSGNAVVQFLDGFGEHVKKHRSPIDFELWRKEINSVLAYLGYGLGKDGRTQRLDTSEQNRVLKEIDDRSRAFRMTLEQREFHPDVVRVCDTDYMMEEDYYRPVKHAICILAEKIRDKAGLPTVGPETADQAFQINWQGWPLLAFSGLRSSDEVSHQIALLHLIRGLLWMVWDERTRLERPPFKMTERDAVDVLSLVSYLHAKVDLAERPQPASEA